MGCVMSPWYRKKNLCFYRRKKEKGKEVMPGPRGPSRDRVGISGEVPVGPPSSGPLPHSRPTITPGQGPQHHPASNVTLDSSSQPQGPHPTPTLPHSLQQRQGIESGDVPVQHPQTSVAPNMTPPAPSPVNVGSNECSSMPSPSTLVPVGPSSGPPAGPPPGPIMGPVRLTMSTSPQQQPVQPQMAPHITQATPSKCHLEDLSSSFWIQK